LSISENLNELKNTLPSEVTLVAVSKTKPVTDLLEAYNAGQRVFGENKIQEMETKWKEMPKDIEWHMIGHVQTNKVKYMAHFVSLIHAVDSIKLLKEINKQALKNDRIINCLIQVKIAAEDSKYGMSETDVHALLTSEEVQSFQNTKIVGLMGMATFTDNKEQVAAEFQNLSALYNELEATHQFDILSMGMSGDYQSAIENGSTMIRVGSMIFGERN
jgi:pyridoxal phosphate enzyme (YggS family)